MNFDSTHTFDAFKILVTLELQKFEVQKFVGFSDVRLSKGVWWTNTPFFTL